MKLIKEQKPKYLEFLVRMIKYLSSEEINIHEQERQLKSIDILANLDDKIKQDFLVKSFVELDSEISRTYHCSGTTAFQLYEPTCAMIELIDKYFKQIRTFTPTEMATLSACTWSYYEDDIKSKKSLFFSKEIIGAISNKYPKNLDNQANTFYYIASEYDDCSDMNEEKIREIVFRIKGLSDEELENFKESEFNKVKIITDY